MAFNIFTFFFTFSIYKDDKYTFLRVFVHVSMKVTSLD